MQPIIITCFFSRRYLFDDWLEDFKKVEHDPANTSLAMIVDGDEPYIVNQLSKLAREGGYKGFQIKVNSQWHPNETKLHIRRMRVADLKNQSKDLINNLEGDIIIGLEDDTVLDRLQSFKQLYDPLLNENTGFVEGVQMGRHGAKIIGAWLADDVYDPHKIETLLPSEGDLEKKYEEITGGGFYGYATRRHLYLNHDYYTSASQPYGPDVNYGFYVNQKGYKCYIDWTLVFGHRHHTEIAYSDTTHETLAKIVFTKNTVTGRWDRSDYERDRF